MKRIIEQMTEKIFTCEEYDSFFIRMSYYVRNIDAFLSGNSRWHRKKWISRCCINGRRETVEIASSNLLKVSHYLKVCRTFIGINVI